MCDHTYMPRTLTKIRLPPPMLCFSTFLFRRCCFKFDPFVVSAMEIGAALRRWVSPRHFLDILKTTNAPVCDNQKGPNRVQYTCTSTSFLVWGCFCWECTVPIAKRHLVNQGVKLSWPRYEMFVAEACPNPY